jgi:hypothetical protein
MCWAKVYAEEYDIEAQNLDKMSESAFTITLVYLPQIEIFDSCEMCCILLLYDCHRAKTQLRLNK